MDTVISFLILVLTTAFSSSEDLAFTKVKSGFTSQPEAQDLKQDNISKIQFNEKSHHDLPLDKENIRINVFPCKRLPPFPLKPKSVHKLRPADINVIAALGDSYTAGKAAGGKTLVSWLFDYRGLSWSIGGDESYATFQSMPNILRQFSPDLYGFSNSIGNYKNPNAGLNVAKDGATSTGLPFQVSTLIKRLKSDTNVDFEEDWKVITLLIGGNDLCRACKINDYTPETYIKNLKQSLNMLQELVPKVFVNLVEIMPVELVRDLHKGPLCNGIHRFYCDCIAFPPSETEFHKIIRQRKEYQRLTEELVNSGIYDTADDFTVVIQPFYRNCKLPTLPGAQKIDYSYFAVDCFHQSKKGQASIGKMLWNNMLQPVGYKTTTVTWNNTIEILCPTGTFPYLATRNNSLARIPHLHNNDQHEPLDKYQVKHESKNKGAQGEKTKSLDPHHGISILKLNSNSSCDRHGQPAVSTTTISTTNGQISKNHVDVGLVVLITAVVVGGLATIVVVILLRRRPTAAFTQQDLEKEHISTPHTMSVSYTWDKPLWETEILNL